MSNSKLPFAQKYGAVISLLIIIFCVVGAFSVAFADEETEELAKVQCLSEQSMASAIQTYREETKMTLNQFQLYVTKGAKFGKPLGGAVLDWQVKIKDAFYARMISMANDVYGYDIKQSPQEVGESFLEVCLVKQLKSAREQEKQPEFAL